MIEKSESVDGGSDSAEDPPRANQPDDAKGSSSPSTEKVAEQETVRERLADSMLNDEFQKALIERELMRRHERDQWRRTLYLSFLGIIGISLLTYQALSPAFLQNLPPYWIQFAAGLTALATAFTLLFAYLQGRKKNNRFDPKESWPFPVGSSQSDDDFSEKNAFALDLRDNEIPLESRSSSEWQASTAGRDIHYSFEQSKENKRSLLGGTVADSQDISDEDIRMNRLLRSLRLEFRATRDRLTAEIDSLGRRGNVNLLIGGLITAVALAMLSIFVFSSRTPLEEHTPVYQHLFYFLPRISLVIFIEVFAFFFLKLYRAGLAEIKFFQNEVTNAEAHYSALLVAASSADPGLLSEVAIQYARVERNFILQKGQSTIELERTRIDAKYDAGMARNGGSLIQNILGSRSK